MFRWLTIYGVAAALSSATLPLFLALGRVRRSALLSWLHLLVLAPALLLPALNGSLADIAAMRAAVAALYVLLVLHSVTRVCPVTARDLLEVLWRPLLCGAVMWLAVGLLHDDGGAHRYLSLGIDVATGVAVFIGLILLTWVLSGRPQGVERTIMTPLASRLQALMVR